MAYQYINTLRGKNLAIGRPMWHPLTNSRAGKMEQRTTDPESLACIPLDIGITYLPDCCNLPGNTLLKGTNYYTQGYVHNIKTFPTDSTVDVKARCWRSMRKSEPPHELRIIIGIGQAQLTDSFCSCKIGRNGKCSHIVGLLKTLAAFKLHGFERVPQQNSCTSMPQQWHKPRGDKVKPVPINQVVVARPVETPRKRKPIICSMDTNGLPEIPDSKLHELRKQLAGTPLGYLLPKETDPPIPRVATPVGLVPLGCLFSYQAKHFQPLQKPATQICSSKGPPFKDTPFTLPAGFEDLKSTVSAEDIEVKTREQAESETWNSERRGRLTASNFGLVLKRKSKPTDSFLTKVLNYAKPVTAASLQYGKRQEKYAKERYLQSFPNRHLHDVGLVINNEFSFLGASPDGIVCDNGQTGIIEIKCPYRCRNLTIKQACEEVPDFYLDKETQSLDKCHEYFAQVQGQLMITGHDFCDFIVFTQKDLHVQRIVPDTSFINDMLTKLATFYKNHALSYIANQK